MSKQTKPTDKPVLNINLRVFVMIGLVFLLFYPPFLRGLFFAPELLMTHMFTAVVFALCWFDKMLKKDLTFIKGGWDYAMLAFIGVYVFSFFGSVNERGAVGEILKVINYVMVYWITAQYVKDEKDVKLVYRAIFFSAVGVAAVGIGAAMGVVEYPGAIVGNRMNSVFQYPNTTGAFVAMGSLLGFSLINTAESRIAKILYGTGNLLLMTVFIASQSRGSWVVLPLVLILFIIGMPGEYRFPTVYNLTVSLAAGLQVAKALIPKMHAGAGLSFGKYLLAGAAAVVVAQWAYDWVIRWMDERDVRESTRRLLGMGFVAYVVIVFAVYVGYTAQAVPAVATHFAPTEALKRADTINSQETIPRLDLYKGALRMAVDYPVNGLGGDGWNALYHQYMPYLTFSSETHSYPLKVLVETGFIGFFALLGLVFFWVKRAFKLWQLRLEEDQWLLAWTGVIAAAMLFFHSFVDFDMSFGAYGMALWGLWGATRGMARDQLADVQLPAVNTRRIILTGTLGTVVAGIMFMAGWSLYTAGTTAAEGAKLMGQREFVKAEAKLKKAAVLDPFSASYPADLAHVYTVKGMQANDPAQRALAEKYAQMAINREPYNYPVRIRLLLIDVQSGRVEQAVDDAESLVANNPLDIQNFEILAKVYLSSGQYLAMSGKQDEARDYWEKILGLGEEVKAKIEELDTEKSRWQGDPLQITPLINLYQGEAAYYLEDFDLADTLLKNAESAKGLAGDLQEEARQFLNAITEQKTSQGGQNG